MSKQNQKSSFTNAVVVVTHPNTATLHNPADTFQTTEMGASSCTPETKPNNGAVTGLSDQN